MTRPMAALPFLVCGLPKSGTTFLQRTLNLHPEISCPSEQSFDALASIIEQMLAHYAGVLETMDRRTGGQGASQYGATIRDEILRSTIGTLSKSFARGRPIHGLNDNSIFTAIERFDNLLGHPRIVAIVRNPVDVGLSEWRHNKRLAREEPRMARAHFPAIDDPSLTVERYLEKRLPSYLRKVDAFLAFADGRGNVMVVRYEQLVANKAFELGRMLDFLGAGHTADMIAGMVAGSSRKAMASASRVPAFFGLDADDPDRATVSREFRRAMLDASMSPRMKHIGYDVASLMVGH